MKVCGFPPVPLANNQVPVQPERRKIGEKIQLPSGAGTQTNPEERFGSRDSDRRRAAVAFAVVLVFYFRSRPAPFPSIQYAISDLVDQIELYK
jgi:hypothetical protein